MNTKPTPAPASPGGAPLPGTASLALSALLGALVLSACTGGPHEPEPPSDEQLLELYSTSATYFYEDDNLAQAQEQAVKALKIDPEDRAMRRMVGWIRIRQGSNEGLLIAERFFRDLIAEGDDNYTTVLGLATALERLGVAYDATSRAITTGDREPPSGVEPASYAAGLEEQAHGNWEEALALYAGTLEGGEGSTRSMNGLQRCHALLGHYDESLRWSGVLLERSQEELKTWRDLLSSADLTEGEEKLYRTNEQAAVDLCRDTHLFAAALLHRQGRFREALPHLDAVIASEPDLPQAYSQRAQVLLELGEYEKARDDLNRFIGLSEAPLDDPDLTHAFQLVAECDAHLQG